MKIKTFIVPTILIMTCLVTAHVFASVNHSNYDALLTKYVNDKGRVDYKSWKASVQDMDSLTGYLSELAGADSAAMTREQAMAFWINAYNAITLKSILDHFPISGYNPLYPSSSIRQIRGVWKKTKHRVAGSEITLSEIEHDVLRAKYNDPRIHFVIVCASIGCPPLRNHAFTAKNLESMMETSTKKFINNTAYNRLDTQENVLNLSKIFKWYVDDFMTGTKESDAIIDHYGEAMAAVVRFISGYLPDTQRKFLNTHRVEIEYNSYDWTLNSAA